MLTVSDTAYAIASVRAREAELSEGERLFEDPYAQVFAAAGDHAREGTERFLALPFFRDGIRLRTRHIDDVVRDAIQHGARQLVLMGAGFDARALRLSEVIQYQVRTFEVDMSALLDTKRALLERSGVALPARVHYVATDFTSELEAKLAEELVTRGLERDAPVMFVWEGVTAYIGTEAVDRSLRLMATLGGAGSRVIFDFSDYLLDPASLPERIRRAGFTSFAEVRFDELWRRHFPGEPPEGAYVAKLGIASK
ncbi:MAG: SAM-dependent methyltransferase [Polyangiaceae bacterium]